MDDPIRRLRAEARQLTHGKIRTAIRYPAAFRAAAIALARPRVGQGASIARSCRFSRSAACIIATGGGPRNPASPARPGGYPLAPAS